MTMPMISPTRSSNVKPWRNEDEFYASTETPMSNVILRIASSAGIVGALVTLLVLASGGETMKTASGSLAKQSFAVERLLTRSAAHGTAETRL